MGPVEWAALGSHYDLRSGGGAGGVIGRSEPWCGYEAAIPRGRRGGREGHTCKCYLVQPLEGPVVPSCGEPVEAGWGGRSREGRGYSRASQSTWPVPCLAGLRCLVWLDAVRTGPA